jgi:hypothetical protein
MSQEPIMHTAAGGEGESRMNMWKDGTRMPEDIIQKLDAVGVYSEDGKLTEQPDFDPKGFARVARELASSDEPHAKQIKEMTLEFAQTGRGKGRIISAANHDEDIQNLGRMTR